MIRSTRRPFRRSTTCPSSREGTGAARFGTGPRVQPPSPSDSRRVRTAHASAEYARLPHPPRTGIHAPTVPDVQK